VLGATVPRPAGPGASRPQSILDSVAAIDLKLTAEELAQLS
jgi:aryl-alcohol dehydrogenase-like predicted oxidoreductase